ncbi:BAG family molecular chaperone regulator 8, chloroplastic-like [Magnolia sinica]|uniref:BAG family molecular chaperone regulator 8, chloroplastic-like n=1 Tax=Magnolia sinica TaxID=86752 RepID=UPI0026597F44|nr:BAG family molecular chaperone regulator 8, chloroplastic-like [Magnolia sinica]
MASHYHHHPHSSHHSPCSCCCCCSSCSSNHHPTPPSPTDPLLQAIATQLLHSQYPKPQHQQQHPHQYHPLKQPQQTQSLLLLQSLLRRVAALESSLHHIYPPSHSHSPPLSLRDIAARTIQTHFRAFLARRSQTLRQLKHLASIKSNLAALKSSLSDKTQLRRPDALSQKVTSLLQKLESIQGGDSMIREGKRAISSELIQLLQFVNGMAAKRQETPSKSTKKVSFSENGNRSRALANAQEPFPSIQAAGNGASIDRRVLCDDQRDLVDELSREIERIEGLSRILENDEQGLDVELEGFQQISDDERNPGKNFKDEGNFGMSGIYQGRNGNLGLSADPTMPGMAAEGSFGMNGIYQGQNGNLGLSAPLPVQMEEIRGSDLGKKKKFARVIG